MSDEIEIREEERTSKLSIVAGLLGLVSFAFGPTGLLAVITGHIGLLRVNRSNGKLRGKGLCIFALVLGYLANGLMLYHRNR